MGEKTSNGAGDRRYRNLFENAIDMIHFVDEQFRIVDVNQSELRKLGRTRDELIGMHISEIIHPDHRADAVEAMSVVRAGQVVDSYETALVAKDGKKIVALANIVPIMVGGEVHGAQTILRDITDRTHVQEQQHRQEQLELLMNSVSDYLWSADIDSAGNSTYRYYSPVVEKITGYPPAYFMKGPEQWLKTIHPEDVPRLQLAVGRLLNRESIREEEDYRVILPDGDLRWVRDSVTATELDDGRIRLHGVVTDFTGRKRAEDKLRQLNEELVRSNHELEQFAYAASHDLRAPLRAIDNLVRWLQEDLGNNFAEETMKRLRLLRGRTDRMDKLLTDLLAFSLVGKREAFIEAVDVGDVVSEAVEVHGGSERIDAVVANDLPTLRTNRTGISRVLSNLIENAAKHHHGRARVEVTADDVGERWEFSVCDDGPGIPPDMREKAFAMFETLRARDEVEGSGMGLALVKKQVGVAGGEVTIEDSTLGGCRVRFTWPKVWPRSS